MYIFGSGVAFGTPILDNNGATVANPSPVEFAVLQDISVDETFEMKELHGGQSYALAAGRGKASIAIKASLANVNAELYNTFLYGTTLTSEYDAIFRDAAGTSLTATNTPTVHGTAIADLGVVSVINGVPYTRVASSPTAGQYSWSAGVWTFSAIDVNKTGYISYVYNNTAGVPTGRKITIINPQMGVQPVFQLDLQQQFEGKTWYVRFPKVIATKLTRAFKNDDFSIPQMEMTAYCDDSGVPYYQWFYE